MASTYVNDLRLNEMATGDQSGSWGTVTNTNLELIAEAFSYSTEAITTNADAHTTTIADGATDPGRSMFLKYTGTLDSACTITIGPNTVSKLWFIENATSGSQNIIIKQGSGATVTIASGKTKVIYSDGVGSGAKMVDAFAALDVGSVSVDNITIDGNEIDVSSGDLTLDVAGDIILDADGGDFRFKDAGTTVATYANVSGSWYITSNVSDADIVFQGNDGGSTIQALTLDMSDAGTAIFNHDAQFPDGAQVRLGADNDLKLHLSGTTAIFGAQNGDMLLDSAGDINLDAGGTDIYLKTQGNSWGHFMTTSNNFYIASTINDGDIIFQGVDGVCGITALTLDMSEGGRANFSNDIGILDGKSVRFGTDNDSAIFHSGSAMTVSNSTGDLTLDTAGNIILDADGGNIRIKDGGTEYGTINKNGTANLSIYSSVSDADMLFQGNDGGSVITALTLDMSQDGTATFNGDVNAPNFNSTSDATLKTNVETLTGSLDAVKSLRGVSFDWLENGGSEVGVIAQEVEDVLPDVVNTNEDGIKSVKYGNIVAVLIEAMKEQQAQIDELKTQLNS